MLVEQTSTATNKYGGITLPHSENSDYSQTRHQKRGNQTQCDVHTASQIEAGAIASILLRHSAEYLFPLPFELVLM